MMDFGASAPWLGSMRHKTTQTVFDYFNRIRGGKPAPLRADIDPAELKTVLPDVFILEMGRNGSPVFRLAGTHICTILGRELRGENFANLWHDTNRHKMKLAAEAVIAHQAPLTVDIRSAGDDERDGELEMLLMPLSSRPGLRDRLFGSLADLSHPPLLSEKARLLWAERLTFVSAAERLAVPADIARNEPLSVATLRNRIDRVLHLRVLDGGRRD